MYYVKWGGIGAELEINVEAIKCVDRGGIGKTHWEIPRDRLLYAEQTARDTITLNFFDGRREMVQVKLRSDACGIIIQDLLKDIAVENPI